MNLTKLSQKTKKVLMNFIDEHQNIIIYAINPYGYMKANIIGGSPPMPYYTLANLKRNGYLQKNKIDKEILYKLTPQGIKLLKKILIEKKLKKKCKRWDKKWRILVFDIPENKRIFRDNMRKILKEIGFYRLQKSVWIYPYDVIDCIYALIPTAKEAKWFNYITAESINREDEIKKYFNLK